jgi:hypothetical protein
MKSASINSIITNDTLKWKVNTVNAFFNVRAQKSNDGSIHICVLINGSNYAHLYLQIRTMVALLLHYK